MLLNPTDNEAGLVLRGLPYGEYQLRLNDVKSSIPVVRNTSVSLSETNKSQTINLSHRERPIKLEVKVLSGHRPNLFRSPMLFGTSDWSTRHKATLSLR